MLHSTGQLFSHKRKHEKRDFEHAYRRFKEDQKTKALSKLPKPTNPGMPAQMLTNRPQGIPPPNTNVLNFSNYAQAKQENPEYIDMEDLPTYNQPDLTLNKRSLSPEMKIDTSVGFKKEDPMDEENSEEENQCDQSYNQAMPSTLAKLASKLSGSSTNLDDSLNLPIPEYAAQDELQDLSLSGIKEELIGNHGGIPTNVPGFVPKVSPPINNKKEKDETWKKYLTRYRILQVS